jgi:hypothetical protein
MKTLLAFSFPRVCDIGAGGDATAEDMKGIAGGLEGGSFFRLYRDWLEGISVCW